MDLRRPGCRRRIETDGCCKVFVFNLDQVARLFGHRLGVGHHHRHRFADETHTLLRQHRIKRLVQLHAVAAGIADDIGQRFEARGFGVIAGQHRFDAGIRQRGSNVDAFDQSMRAVSAQKHRV